MNPNLFHHLNLNLFVQIQRQSDGGERRSAAAGHRVEKETKEESHTGRPLSLTGQ